MDLDFLDASLVCEGIGQDMNGAGQIRIGHSRKERLVSVHEPKLRVLEAGFVLGARSALE